MTRWEELLSDNRMLRRENHRNAPLFWEGYSPWGVVVTAHYRATAAGVRILSEGGNAVDAAIAASLTLGVVEPGGSGLGGMAMMMMHLAEPQRTFLLAGPCRAPLLATPEQVAASPRKSGYRAVAVPTYPAVLGYALKHYGRLSPRQVCEPAIGLAETGYPISAFQYKLMKEYASQIRKGNAAHFLLGQDNHPPLPGTNFRQPVLARTLKRLAAAGFEDFYAGQIGERILADMARNNGFITRSDLENIPWPEEVEPLSGHFRRWTIRTMPHRVVERP